MDFTTTMLQYAVPLLLATLNGLAAWTLYTVLSMRSAIDKQEVINDKVEVWIGKQEKINELNASRFDAGTKLFTTHAIEIRNINVWKKRVDRIIDDIRGEENKGG